MSNMRLRKMGGSSHKFSKTSPWCYSFMIDKVIKMDKTQSKAAEKRKVAEMTEGYKAMGKEQKQLAEMAAKVAPEVLPEWLLNNPKALASVRRGLADAAKGKVSKIDAASL